MEKFEQYIIKNKNYFNQEIPDRKKIWRDIEKKMYKKTFNFNFLARVAAILIVVFTISMIFYQKFNQNDIFVTKEYKEFKEATTYYNTLINEKFSEIEKILKNNPELLMKIKKEIYVLDNLNKELKKDMKEEIAPVQVMEAIIQNYRTRLTILENLLLQLKNVTYEENFNSPQNGL